MDLEEVVDMASQYSFLMSIGILVILFVIA